MSIKNDRRYTSDHEWAKKVDGGIQVGVTAYAVEQLQDITLVNIDAKVGDTVKKGAAFGTIESVKTLSDLFAPVSGVVTRLNTELESKPELVNEDCWGKGWVIAIRPSKLDAEKESLLDPSAYKQHLVASAH